MDYLQKILLVIIANFMPTTEQIGGITLGLSIGLDPMTVLVSSLTVNCLLFFSHIFWIEIIIQQDFQQNKIIS